MAVPPPPPEHCASDEKLSHALTAIVARPLPVLFESWNWKSASVSAIIRGCIFLTTNLRAGGHSALRAMTAESLFAIFAAGVMGGVTQRLRNTRPIAATALIIWLILPACMVSAEAALHLAIHTPHMKAGLISSFVMAAFSSGFSWYAQRRGVLLAGQEQAPAAQDLRRIPSLILDFVLAAPRAVLRGSVPR
jgi:hypothetical protein